MQQLSASINKLSEITELERDVLNKTQQMPSIEALEKIVDLSRRIFFPGYFTDNRQNENSRHYFIGAYMDNLYDILKTQVRLSFLTFTSRQLSEEEIDTLVLRFMDSMPEIKEYCTPMWMLCSIPIQL